MTKAKKRLADFLVREFWEIKKENKELKHVFLEPHKPFKSRDDILERYEHENELIKKHKTDRIHIIDVIVEQDSYLTEIYNTVSNLMGDYHYIKI